MLLYYSGTPESTVPNLAEMQTLLQQVAASNKLTTETFGQAIKQVEGYVNVMAKTFGGLRTMAQGVRDVINEATPSVLALGGAVDDVGKMQMGIVSTLKTQTVLNAESYKDLYASVNLVNDGVTDTTAATAKLTKSFTDAGYGIYNISREVTGIVNQARQLGVSTTAVYSQIDANIGKLNMYSFEGGVQGMAKMAANATLLRIDMKDTLAFADKVFNPEDAIKMAGTFQRLGTQVSSLLDPYKLMDMARNSPEKLQEAVGEAMKSLSYFNEETQKMDILPEYRGIMRQLATETGYPLETLMKMATVGGDLERKMKEIRFPKEFSTEEDRKMIAGMAQLGEKGTKFEGKYVVTYDTGKIDEKTGMAKMETKEVSELNPDDFKYMKEGSKPAQSAVDLQRAANGYLENMMNDINAMRGALPRALAARAMSRGKEGDNYMSMLEKAGADLSVVSEGLKAFIGITRKPSTTGDKEGYLSPAELNQTMAKMNDSILKLIDNVLQGNIAGATAEGAKMYGDITGQLKQNIKNVPGAVINRADTFFGEGKGETVYQSIVNIANNIAKMAGMEGFKLPENTKNPKISETKIEVQPQIQNPINEQPKNNFEVTPNIVQQGPIINYSSPIMNEMINNLKSQNENLNIKPYEVTDRLKNQVQVVSTASPTNVIPNITTQNNNQPNVAPSQPNAAIDVNGNININVTATEFKESLMRALENSDVHSKISAIVSDYKSNLSQVIGNPSTYGGQSLFRK